MSKRMKIVKDLANTLVSTDLQTIETIKLYEHEGRFNEHIDTGAPVPEYIPVDGKYKYVTKNPFTLIKNAILRALFVKPFIREANRLFNTEVHGKEHLQGVNGCIICCNHVNKLDSMAVVYALEGKTIYTTGAEFNNMKGFLGDMMRVGRLMPLSSSYNAMKNFDEAVTKLLKKGCGITFFPERAEWWGYEKPRPLMNGAYRYAVKNNVPILPIFITFEPTVESQADPTALKKFIVNILPPIYPDKTLTPRTRAEQLKEENAKAWQKCYDEFYNT